MKKITECPGCSRRNERTADGGWRKIKLNSKGVCAACQDAADESDVLTVKEHTMLEIVADAADENGGDFAVMRTVRQLAIKRQLSGQQWGGLLTQLQDKGLIEIHAAIEVNGGTSYAEMVQQITLDWERVDAILA